MSLDKTAKDSTPMATATRKFRKRPVVIEAIQFDGANEQEIFDWMGSKWPDDEKASAGAYGNWNDDEKRWEAIGLWIKTLEGTMDAAISDWIIKGVNGEFYPCKPDIFTKTYEAVAIEVESGSVGEKA